MTKQIFERRSTMPAPVEDLFAYHEAEGAFLRLNPPWEPVEILRHEGGIRDGAIVDIKLKLGPISQRWHLTHQNYIENQQFEDAQVKGMFKYWVHQHLMESAGDQASILRDRIEYVLPMGILGQIFGGGFARAKLARMFTYRHEITQRDLARHQAVKAQGLRKIGMTGSSGLIGSQLTAFLRVGGHEVKRIIRQNAKKADEIYWNPQEGTLNPQDLAGLDAIVHLAGENIGAKRWTDAQKKRIMESRTKGTRLLAETLAAMPADQRPKVLVSVSGSGYYREAGAQVLDENSPSGESFQAEVCRAWEAALQPAIDAGIRVVILRMGVVLSLNGGALQRMLTPFLMGVGGIIGNGQQYMSWIALDDALDIFHAAIMDESMQGVYNATAPQPLPNRDFTKILGRVIKRPTLIPIPAFGLRLLFGQLADALLLGSRRVEPKRLKEMGFEFRYPELESALRHALGRQK